MRCCDRIFVTLASARLGTVLPIETTLALRDPRYVHLNAPDVRLDTRSPIREARAEIRAPRHERRDTSGAM
jgi:hypothetical protein